MLGWNDNVVISDIERAAFIERITNTIRFHFFLCAQTFFLSSFVVLTSWSKQKQ
jgi:hypothetical protein